MAKARYFAEQAAARSATGMIEPHILYRLDEAEERLGWTRSTTRAARRNGLLVRYAGKRAYVVGRDLIAYVEQHGKVDR